MGSRQRFILEVNDRMVAGMLCEVGKRSLTPVVSSHVEVGPEQDYLEAAREVLARCGAGNCPCCLALPVSVFHFKNLNLPFTDQRKINEVLRYELADLVSFADEAFVFGTVATGSSGSHTRLLAAVAREKDLNPWLEFLSVHALEPWLVTFSPMGRLIQVIDGGRRENHCIYLDAGQHQSSCFVIRRGTIQSIRPLPGLAGGSGRILSEELQRTMLGLAGGETAAAGIDLLIAGAAADKFDIEPLAAAGLFAKISVIDSGDISVSGDPATQMLPVYLQHMLSGTAALKPDDVRLINIAAGSSRDGGGFKKISRLVPLLALLLAALLLGSAYQVYEYREMARQRDRLIAEAEQIYAQTVDGSKPATDPLLALKARIGEIDESAVAGIVEHPDIKAVNILADISSRLPATVRVSFDRFSFDREKVRINGTTDTYNDVDRIRKSLGASLLYAGVSIDSAGSAGNGKGVKFALTLLL